MGTSNVECLDSNIEGLQQLMLLSTLAAHPSPFLLYCHYEPAECVN